MKKIEKKVVYIIDDQAIYAEIMKENLKSREAKVYTFVSGEDALTSTAPSPDVVVLDYELDDGSQVNENGIAVLRKLKNKFPEVEVVMLSGHEDVRIATTSIKFGAYDYVVKNENAAINLKNRVRNIFRKMNILNEVYELTRFKRSIFAIVAVTGVFGLFVEIFMRNV